MFTLIAGLLSRPTGSLVIGTGLTLGEDSEGRPVLTAPNAANNLDGLSDVVLTAVSSGDFLRYNGTDWVNSKNGASLTSLNASNLASGVVPSSVVAGSYAGITGVGVLAAGTWNANAIGAVYGGTGQTTWTLGDLLYASATNTLAKLAGNTANTVKYLRQVGTGTVSAAPTWQQIAYSEISGTPTLAPTTAQYVTLATDATLTNERVLAVEATVLTLTDGGAGGNVMIAVAANGITNAKLRQSAGLSVLGRSANTTGNVADITAALDGQVLRRSGTTIGFGAVDLASANAVTGTLPDARLSSNVPLKNVGNVFTGQVTVDRATGNINFASRIAGNSFTNWHVTSDGVLNWGSGAGVEDTNLYRSAANLLKTDDAFESASTVKGTQLVSTVGTGTAPLVVASTTVVVNLNADYLDGQSGSFYQNAGNLNAGTIADARLSTNVDLLNATQTITALKRFQAAAAATVVWTNMVSGDSVSRLAAYADGMLEWGPGGATARDTNLYRSAANVLSTDDALSVGGVLSVASRLSFTAAADAIIGMNTSDGADTLRTFLSATSGTASVSRGAYVGASGNEHATTPGVLLLVAGATGNIQTLGTILPTNDGQDSLGSGAKQFADLFLSGQLVSSIATGTAPLAITSTTLVSNLTAHYLGAVSQDAAFFRNATNLNAGTVADARLSSNVALLTGAQTFSGQKSFAAPVSYTGSTSAGFWGDGVLIAGTNSNPSTGALVITLPWATTTSRMVTLRITGYTYTSTQAVWEYVIGGYCYWSGTANQFINTGYYAHGALGRGVQFAVNGGNYVLIIGADSDTWYYPKIRVDAMTGYQGSSTELTGWTAAFVSDTSSYTVKTAVTRRQDVPWSLLTGTPTTAAGYGLTDVVTTSGNQSIAGTKTFTGRIEFSGPANGLSWRDTDLAVDAGGLWQIVGSNNAFQVLRNTAAAGDWSAYDQVLVATTTAFTWMGKTVANLTDASTFAGARTFTSQLATNTTDLVDLVLRGSPSLIRQIQLGDSSAYATIGTRYSGIDLVLATNAYQSAAGTDQWAQPYQNASIGAWLLRMNANTGQSVQLRWAAPLTATPAAMTTFFASVPFEVTKDGFLTLLGTPGLRIGSPTMGGYGASAVPGGDGVHLAQVGVTSGEANWGLIVNDGTNNRRAKLFVDDTNGVWGLRHTWSANGLPFSIIFGNNGAALQLSTGGNLTLLGTAQATRLISTVATGTAPFTVTSTTKVTNLDAHYLGAAGQDDAFFRNATNLNAGTVADARLSSNVALLTGTQTFAGAKSFSTEITSTVSQNRVLYGNISDGSFIQLGAGNTGYAAVFGSTRHKAAAALDYKAYMAYDAYWDEASDTWQSLRTTLGDKYLYTMGYHEGGFKWYTSSSGSSIAWTNLATLTKDGDFSTTRHLTVGALGQLYGGTPAIPLAADHVLSYDGTKWINRRLQTSFTTDALSSDLQTDNSVMGYANTVTSPAGSPPAPAAAPSLSYGYKSVIIDMSATTLLANQQYLLYYSTDNFVGTNYGPTVVTSTKVIHSNLDLTKTYYYRYKTRGASDSANSATANTGTLSSQADAKRAEINPFALIAAGQITAGQLSAISSNLGTIVAGVVQDAASNPTNAIRMSTGYSLPTTANQLTSGMLSTGHTSGGTQFTSFSATNCVDGDTATGDIAWSTDTATAGAYLKIDLGVGNAKRLQALDLYMSAAGSTAIYQLRYSDDDSTYTTVTSFTAPLAGLNKVRWVLAAPHRYWRLQLVNTPGAGPEVNEIEMRVLTTFLDLTATGSDPFLRVAYDRLVITADGYASFAGDVSAINLTASGQTTLQGATVEGTLLTRSIQVSLPGTTYGQTSARRTVLSYGGVEVLGKAGESSPFTSAALLGTYQIDIGGSVTTGGYTGGGNSSTINLASTAPYGGGTPVLVSSNPPAIGGVYAVYASVHQTDNSLVASGYTGTDVTATLYKSTDGGSSWTAVGTTTGEGDLYWEVVDSSGSMRFYVEFTAQIHAVKVFSGSVDVYVSLDSVDYTYLSSGTSYARVGLRLNPGGSIPHMYLVPIASAPSSSQIKEGELWYSSASGVHSLQYYDGTAIQSLAPASTTATGVIKLTGCLGGTGTSPTVVGLKFTQSNVIAAQQSDSEPNHGNTGTPTRGRVLTYGNNDMGWSSSPVAIDHGTRRTFVRHQVSGTQTSSMFALGGATDNSITTPTIQKDAQGVWHNYTSGTTVGNSCGTVGSSGYNMITYEMNPTFWAYIRTGSTTTQRITVGLLTAAQGNTDNLSARGIAVMFRSTANIQIVYHNGTSSTNAGSLGTWTTSTLYLVKIRIVGTNAYVSLNGGAETTVAVTGLTTQDTSWECRAHCTTGGTAGNFRLQWVHLEYGA